MYLLIIDIFIVGDVKQLRADVEVTRLLSCCNLPFSLAEDDDFKHFMQFALPQMVVKAPTTYSRQKLPILYKHVKDALFEKIKRDMDTLGGVGLTTGKMFKICLNYRQKCRTYPPILALYWTCYKF
jgi:hypothetical protein